MKLLRWAVAGASVYAVYKYSIGKKAKGEDVFTSPERAVAELEAEEAEPVKPKKPQNQKKAKAAKPKAKSTKKASKE